MVAYMHIVEVKMKRPSGMSNKRSNPLDEHDLEVKGERNDRCIAQQIACSPSFPRKRLWVSAHIGLHLRASGTGTCRDIIPRWLPTSFWALGLRRPSWLSLHRSPALLSIV